MSTTRLLRNAERILTVIDIIQVSASMLDSGSSHIMTCYKGQAKTNRQIFLKVTNRPLQTIYLI